MILNILGFRGPYPGKDEPTSGYLLRTSYGNILIDCGSGVLSKLLKLINFDEISFILCSHLHADHVSDLGVLRYYFASCSKGIDLFIPSEPQEEYSLLKKGVFNIKKIEENLEKDIEGIRIKFFEGQHSYKSYAIRIEDGGRVFVYSGDTGYLDGLVDFCKGADLLLLNSGYTDEEVEKIDPEKRFHLSPKQAAEIASRSGAKLLVLTHLKPQCDDKKHLTSAKSIFENVLIASRTKVIEF